MLFCKFGSIKGYSAAQGHLLVLSWRKMKEVMYVSSQTYPVAVVRHTAGWPVNFFPE